VVYVNGQKEDKAGHKVNTTDTIEVRQKMKYVSRGGYKLEKAIEVFNLGFDNKICMDVGASTGGFTDCMLQNGALKVYSIDVGYGQLAWTLRQDERVICMEKTNMRYVENLDDKIDFSSIDVSFISLTKILGAVSNLLADDAEIVALIKPQFEAGREQVEKNGVVRNAKVHADVIRNVWNYAVGIGLYVKGLDFSPIKGPEGNREYLIHFTKIPSDVDVSIEQIVDISHQVL
ncbi:MAG: rRNA methyltransferase, partial [Epulopiscium sp. Nele67-Bin001]